MFSFFPPLWYHYKSYNLASVDNTKQVTEHKKIKIFNMVGEYLRKLKTLYLEFANWIRNLFSNVVVCGAKCTLSEDFILSIKKKIILGSSLCLPPISKNASSLVERKGTDLILSTRGPWEVLVFPCADLPPVSVLFAKPWVSEFLASHTVWSMLLSWKICCTVLPPSEGK